MQEIYIVLTQTGTILSRIVKFALKREYAHASIAVDKNLDTLYSFGRRNPYNPFWGGFVEEGKNIGTFKRFHKTICRVYTKEVTDEQYEKLLKNIENFKQKRAQYYFNVWGLILAWINRYKQRRNKFYCSEFVKYILNISGVDTSNLSEVPYPMCFTKLDGIHITYEGLLKEYAAGTGMTY